MDLGRVILFKIFLEEGVWLLRSCMSIVCSRKVGVRGVWQLLMFWCVVRGGRGGVNVNR